VDSLSHVNETAAKVSKRHGRTDFVTVEDKDGLEGLTAARPGHSMYTQTSPHNNSLDRDRQHTYSRRPLIPGSTDSSRDGDPIGHGAGNDQRSESGSVDVQRFGRLSVLHFNGDLIDDSAATLDQAVAEELQRSPEHVTLDLRGVKCLDSIGIDGLLSDADLASECAVSFVLVAAEAGPVGAALAKADVRQRFEVFPTVQEAWDHHSR
jgi:anti-anti-sigma factor